MRSPPLFGQELPLVGLGDIRVGEFNPKSVFFSTLTQDPSYCAYLTIRIQLHYCNPWRVDLQLSGHTHGGQIILPRLGPSSTTAETD